MRIRLASLLCGMSATLFMSIALADEHGARALLERSSAGNGWDKASAAQVDIDSDGKPDYVFLRQDATSATVALILGAQEHRVITRTFRIGGQSQSDLCSGPVSITVESLDYDPMDEPGAIGGFRRSKAGVSFALVDGECDAFHFYWDVAKKDLAWWRL
ncbi:hypothetical protein ISN76_18970 [Dyella halodurans]|uniref:VCBS repeat-containing protein n=1 Tax=Dyella halodurans TaxID=1920171 RepID=A0ABV9C059_9GAMM|nr:hypothetical protein [Dyella halodurans]